MKLNKDEYVKDGIVPTRLKYTDLFPSNSRYKTPDSIKFIKDFDFKKKKEK